MLGKIAGSHAAGRAEPVILGNPERDAAEQEVDPVQKSLGPRISAAMPVLLATTFDIIPALLDFPNHLTPLNFSHGMCPQGISIVEQRR